MQVIVAGRSGRSGAVQGSPIGADIALRVRYRDARWPRRAPGERPGSVPGGDARSTARAAWPLFGIVAVLALVTLILTAFGSSSPQRVATTVDLAPVASGVPPEPEILATVSNLQIRLPIAGEAVTAIGFHGSDAGAMELDPVGRQANEGLLARLWRRIAGSSNDGPVWYQLEGGPGTRGARRRRGPGHGRLLPRRRHGRLDLPRT